MSTLDHPAASNPATTRPEGERFGRDAAIGLSDAPSLARPADRLGALVVIGFVAAFALLAARNLAVAGLGLAAGRVADPTQTAWAAIISVALFVPPLLVARGAWRQRRVRLSSYEVRGVVRSATLMRRRKSSGTNRPVWLDYRSTIRFLDPPFLDREAEAEWTIGAQSRTGLVPTPGKIMSFAVATDGAGRPLVHGPAKKYADSYLGGLAFTLFFSVLALAASWAATA